MQQVYTTSTGAGNRIENKERYLYENVIELFRRAISDSK